MQSGSAITIPDAALHKPALFKELSGFFASRGKKLPLPSRASNIPRNKGKNLGHWQEGSKSTPLLAGMDAEFMFGHYSNAKEATGISSHGKIETTCGKGEAKAASLGSHGDGQTMCEACRRCGCHKAVMSSAKCFQQLGA